MDLTGITGQTIEIRHVYDVHLGETVVPYATLDPLKAVLPLRTGDAKIPSDTDGPGGIDLTCLDQRMRGRWRAISDLWETNKAPVNRLVLLNRLNYHGGWASQVLWQQVPNARAYRVIYPKAGQPTAALLIDDSVLVDYTTYWVTCTGLPDANFLLAIINSDAIADAVNPLTTPNWSGRTRDLEKHLWKLPIPEFDPANSLHVAISEAGETAAAGAAQQLAQLREQRDNVTVTIARREIRKWLRESEEGETVEMVVAKLLAGA